MKKASSRMSLAALALVCALLLGGCGAKSASTEDFWGMGGANSADFDAAQSSPTMEPESPADAGNGWTQESWDGVMDSAGQAVKPAASLAEKIIYSSNVRVETTDFEGAVEAVDGMLERYGAFLESSSVDGKSYEAEYYGYKTYRSARYTIRVPVESFEAMRDSMGDVGSVLSVETYTENITTQYYDVQSRVDSYKIEQERLMEMLGKCTTVSEMIEVESRLSEVRYQLESYETTLRNWQNEVDYSTIDLTISEVREYTEIEDPHRTYWQEIGDGLKSTLRSIGNFFKDLFRDIVVALPVLAIIAVIVIVVVVIVIRSARKKKNRRDGDSDDGGQEDK